MFSCLAVSGSLRAASINSAFLRTAVRLAPASTRVRLFAHMAELPLFNPDLEPAPPAVVTDFRSSVEAADALLIASPEYAHGVSGALKNALDWLVSSEGVVGKPVALINTSPRAHHAHDSLAEILTTMSLRIVPAASLALPLHGHYRTEHEMAASPEVRGAIASIFAALSSGAR
jgi:chromate reductase, NAD(P)H dehydrogenase (quinone)